MELTLCKNKSQNTLDNFVKCERNGNLCVSQCKNAKSGLLSNVKSPALLRESSSDCKKDMFACQV